MLANTVEFLGCTCCQSDKDRLDWTNTYALPKKYQKTQPGGEGVASESDEGSNVRIPLPFSRTWDPTQDKLEKARKKFNKRQVCFLCAIHSCCWHASRLGCVSVLTKESLVMGYISEECYLLLYLVYVVFNLELSRIFSENLH